MGSWIGTPEYQNNQKKQYKTLKNINFHRASLEQIETITPKSMAYYKKVRRPQSAIAPVGTSKNRIIRNKIHGAFESHMKTLTTEKAKPRRIAKKKASLEPKPKYSVNTVLSNKSGALNLKQLFSENSNIVSITMIDFGDKLFSLK